MTSPVMTTPATTSSPKTSPAMASSAATASAQELTRADVEKVSLLARLRLNEEELSRLTVELGQIVHFVEQLKSLDTTGVAPLAHALDVTNVLADDEVRPSLDRELALANAPKRDDECYRVPAVLGE